MVHRFTVLIVLILLADLIAVDLLVFGPWIDRPETPRATAAAPETHEPAAPVVLRRPKGVVADSDSDEIAVPDLVLVSHARIVVRVIDEKGEPIPDASYRLTSDASDGPVESNWDDEGRRPRGDDEGRIRIDAVAARTYRLLIDRAGYVPRQVEISASSDAGVETTVQLSRGLRVAGVVRAMGDGPVSGIVVFWRSSTKRIAPFDRTRGARLVVTDADGRFEITGLEEGSVEVLARMNWFAEMGNHRATVDAGDEKVELELLYVGPICWEPPVRGLDDGKDPYGNWK